MSMKVPQPGDAPRPVPSKTVLESKSHTGRAAKIGFEKLKQQQVLAMYTGKSNPLQGRHTIRKTAVGRTLQSPFSK